MGAQNSNQGKNTKYYQLKAKTSETENPHFALSEKVNGSWTTTGTFDTISGLLCSAKIQEKEYEGVKSNVFVLTIEDEQETSKIQLTHNMITHSIINSLAGNINKLSTYSIQVYKKQDNGKWWGKASVKIDGEKSSWAIDPKTAPKKEPVMVNGKPFMQNGKQVFDDSALKAFYEDLFRTKVIAPLGGESSAKSTVMAKNEANPVVDNPDNDQLPF